MANNERIGNASNKTPRTFFDSEERANDSCRAGDSNMHCETLDSTQDVDSDEQLGALELHQGNDSRGHLLLDLLHRGRSWHEGSLSSISSQHLGTDVDVGNVHHTNCSPPRKILATKNEYISQLEPLTCGICGDEFRSEHIPIQMPDCKHIFGFHCIVQWFEMNQRNANKCPICRQPLFVSEYDSDEESDGSNSMYNYSGEQESSEGTPERESDPLPADDDSLDSGDMEAVGRYFEEEVAGEEEESVFAPPRVQASFSDDTFPSSPGPVARTGQKRTLPEDNDDHCQGSPPGKRHQSNSLNHMNSRLTYFGFSYAENASPRRSPPRNVPTANESPPRYLLGPGRFTGLGQSARQRVPYRRQRMGSFDSDSSSGGKMNDDE